MTSRGIRNRNPGNIIQSAIPWQGKLPNPTDDRFEQFDTDLNGIRALAKLLLSYEDKHGLRTVRGIINRWAPPVENNTSAYVAAVAAALGVGQDDTISTHRQDTLQRLTVAIIQHENGQQPYPVSLIAAAVADALGVPVEAAPPKLNQRKDAQMGALLAAFGPLIAELIPQVSKLFVKGERGEQNVAAATAVFDAVVKASGQTNIQAAVEAMQVDPALTKTVTAAVVTDPEIVGLLEIGGGIKAAREQDAAVTQAEKGFWYSPAFWFAVLVVMPPVDFMVAVVVWRMSAPSEQLVTQVVTGLLGLIAVAAAFYYGSAYGSQKKDVLLAEKSR